MKIALVSAEFPPERGGIQTYAWEYAQALARRGHAVTVFTQAHPAGEMQGAPFAIEPVLRLRRRLDRAPLLRGDFDLWHALNAAYSWLALEAAPVFVTVHGNDFLAPYQPVARLDLRTRLRLPFGSRGDQWLGARLTRRLVRRALPQCARIFTNSHYTEQRLCALVPACAGRTSPAMVGVAGEWFSQARPPRQSGPARLITVCRLVERHKNVDLVLRAFQQLSGEYDLHYTIVGDGELRPELEALTRTLGLADRVTFTGFLSQPAMQELLLRADLFILPTTATSHAYEGFGLVYLEANACGCPVLAARIGGAVEAVDEGSTGFFIDTVSPDSLATALRRFLSGEIPFEAAACVAFARRFTWDAVAQHCEAAYTAALAR